MTDEGAGQVSTEPPEATQQQKITIPAGPPSDVIKDGKSDDILSDVKRGEKWLIGINGLSLIATVVVAIIYYKELVEMRRATNASQESAYAACVGAQISRSTLIEIQKGGSDTHGVALASVYQAMAATQAESAVPRVLIGHSRMQLGESMGFTYQIANQGKTSATRVELQIKAIFQPTNSKIVFSYPDTARLTYIKWGILQAGSIEPTDDQNRANPTGISVRDESGQVLLAKQQDVDDYSLHRKILIAYGKITYQDAFGVHHWATFCGISEAHQSDVSTNSGNRQCTDYNKTDTNRVLYKPVQPVSQATTIPEIPCTPPGKKNP